MGFKGRSSLKQFSPDKSTKWGYKVWCRCDSHTGYNSYFEIYLGKQGDTTEKGLGRKVVLNMTKDIYNKGYHVYFDNFFLALIWHLSLLIRKLTVEQQFKLVGKVFQVLISTRSEV